MTTVSEGTSFVTTAPIATTLFFPILTPALITALLPIMALSSIITPTSFHKVVMVLSHNLY